MGIPMTPVILPLSLALLAAYGVHLLYTALSLRWTGLGPGPATDHDNQRRRAGRVDPRTWLVQAGLEDVRLAEFAAVVGVLFVIGLSIGAALFRGLLPALACALFAASFPPTSYRARRERRRAEAHESWPHLIEEIRLLTGSVGRSVPQALLEVGRRGPVELRPAFAAAEREWRISTDFARTVAVLQTRLADPTADAACETLLVAHEVGGADLDRRLEALAEDRLADLQGRKDARAKQAGVRFARRFVLIVPVGMALVGLSLGTGDAAYRSGSGQMLAATAVAMVVACWFWAGRLLRLPEEQRVFGGQGDHA